MLALLLLSAAVAPPLSTTPLNNAHAHNDYAHKRPLLDALDQGFTSVEADVFLVGRKLLVGHSRLELRSERTLEALYLNPLKKRVSENKGRIYPLKGKEPAAFILLVDIKTNGKAAYQTLDVLLRKYDGLFTEWNNGKFTPRAVTVVISGDCPREVITGQKSRLAAIDGRPGDLDSDAPAHLIPLVSASWGSQFRYNGIGKMPQQERERLRDFVTRAHQKDRRVRFWATPERETLWGELRDAKVDLINTDQLARLRRFLLMTSPNQ